MCCVVYGAKGVRVKGRAECKEEEGGGRGRGCEGGERGLGNMLECR